MRQLLVLVFLLMVACFPLEAEKLKIDLSARYAILINAETGQVLYEKEPDTPSHPGSTTKVATAAYLLERWKDRNLDEMIVPARDPLLSVPLSVRKTDPNCPSYRLTSDGTIMGIKFNEKLSLKTILTGLITVSGNDAANVLAHECSGSVDTFMEELNGYLKEKGMTRTYFNNPHGYHHPQQVTTARDLAFLMKEAMQYPLFREIVKMPVFHRPETNVQAAIELAGTNKLLRKGAYYYSKATGGKTGYTDVGRSCFVASAEDGNRSLIAVLLHCNERKQMFRDMVRLFEEAFSESKVTRTLFAKGYNTFTHEVKGAAAPLHADLVEDFTLSFYPSEEPEFRTLLNWYPLQMPIRSGDLVGKIELVAKDGSVIKRGLLEARRAVVPTFLYSLKTVFQRWKTLIAAVCLCLAITAAVFRIARASQRA